MKRRVRTIILIIFFLANSGGVCQVNAICENQDNTPVISVEFTREKEFLFLNIQAQAINPIFSCEFSLKYNANILQFIEYQTEQDWLTVVSEKKTIEILQSRLRQYTYWITGEQISLGTLKFKVIKETPSLEFVFENPIVIEIEQFIEPKINERLCWPKKIKIIFPKK